MSTEYNDNFTVKDFEIGDNIELHPATDAWMSGDRFGMVSKLGVKYVYVLMDKSDKTLKMLPKDVGKWNGPGQLEPLEDNPIYQESEDIEVLIDEGYAMAKSGTGKTVAGEFNFGYNEFMPLPNLRPEPEPAKRFKVQGKTISTRSSNPTLRKIAKRLAKKVSK